jgi:hypothetical protein
MDSSLWIKSCCRNFLMNASALSLMSWPDALLSAFFGSTTASFDLSTVSHLASPSLPCSTVGTDLFLIILSSSRSPLLSSPLNQQTYSAIYASSDPLLLYNIYTSKIYYYYYFGQNTIIMEPLM